MKTATYGYATADNRPVIVAEILQIGIGEQCDLPIVHNLLHILYALSGKEVLRCRDAACAYSIHQRQHDCLVELVHAIGTELRGAADDWFGRCYLFLGSLSLSHCHWHISMGPISAIFAQSFL